MLDVTGRGIIGAMSVIDFIAARLDEFEAGIDTREHDSGQCDWLQGIHLDAAEALRWVGFLRMLVDTLITSEAAGERISVLPEEIAAIWSDHPDYDPAWA